VRDSRTPASLVAEIKMLRPCAESPSIIVEGNADHATYSELVPHRAAHYVVADCGIQHNIDGSARLTAIWIVEQCGALGLDAAVGMVDADFARLDGVPARSSLVMTDGHDLELMAIKYADALRRVLRSVANRASLDAWEAKYESLEDAVLKVCRATGLLMWLSLTRGLGLSFKELPFGRFLDAGLEFEVRQMVQEVCNKSCRHDIDADSLAQDLDAELATAHDLYECACGHHVSQLVAWIFSNKGPIAPRRVGQLGSERIDQEITLCLTETDFVGTSTHSSLQYWHDTLKQPRNAAAGAARVCPTNGST